MVSVVIPALNEAKTIYDLILFARRNRKVSEVIVIDDGSIDETANLARDAGATVISSMLLGKGASMEEGMQAAKSQFIVYLDGDLTGLDENLIDKLIAPLLADEADFVKAKFTREAGRVTTLTAKPLLQIFFPELAHIDQPLGGIIAVKKSLLQEQRFESDYGADLGLLIDVWASGARIVQAEIGRIEHDSQPLDKLGEMASQVVRTLFDRAATYERFCQRQVEEVTEVERCTRVELDVVLSKIGNPDRIALVDMDGTLLEGRFVVELATRLGREGRLAEFLDHPTLSAEERTLEIAKIFADVPDSFFRDTAHSMPLAEGAAPLVIGLRKAGYRVGIVTDSYHVAADTVRRRVFADFTVAHVMKLSSGLATGELVLSPAMIHDRGCKTHTLCKANVLKHLSEKTGVPASDFVAIGDGHNDVCMLKKAGQSFAVNTSLAEVRRAAKAIIEGDLTQILAQVSAFHPSKVSSAKTKLEPPFPDHSPRQASNHADVPVPSGRRVPKSRRNAAAI